MPWPLAENTVTAPVFRPNVCGNTSAGRANWSAHRMHASSPDSTPFELEDRQDPRCFVQPAITCGQGIQVPADEHPHDPRCFMRPHDSGQIAPRTAARHIRKANGAALTAREREIARLLTEHLSNRDVARRLHISTRTVEHHVQSVLERMGLRSRFQVTAELLARHEASIA
jgi:DNA-binding CsgD family transcriptional regulator